MTSPSSTFKPKLNDQQYMELVFENGQILAKGQRSKVSLQNQRTTSIMDFYEVEYNEDFMKSIIHSGGGAIKNLGDTQVVPQNHVVVAPETNMLETNKHVDDSTLIETLKASLSKRVMVDYDNRKKIDFLPPDEQSVVAERTVESGFDTSSAGFTEDSEGSTYLSSMMTMGNRFVTPSMMLPLGLDYSQMGVAMGMGMPPQYLPVPVLGAGLPGINNSANMLSFLNHSGLVPMQNSAPFTPTETCSPQSVPPSCATYANQIPNPIFLSNLDGSTPYTRNQGTPTDGGILSGKKSGNP